MRLLRFYVSLLLLVLTLLMIVTTTGSIIMVIDDNVIMISIATAIDRVVYAFICIYQLC